MQPRWGWSGVSELESTDEQSRIRPLIAMLPRTKSGDAAVLARLIDLRARFHGWLHQDEFGAQAVANRPQPSGVSASVLFT